MPQQEPLNPSRLKAAKPHPHHRSTRQLRSQGVDASQERTENKGVVSSPPPLLSHALIQRSLANPRALAPSDVLQLQRTIGNRAVSQLLGEERPVSSGTHSSMQRAAGVEGGLLNGQLAAEIRQAQGGGSPLPDTIREGMENRMGLPYGDVRIHTDAKADRLSRSLNAEAFTLGTDTYFRKGAYNPTSHSGKQLLTHELTHVAQQTGGHQEKIQTKLQVGPENNQFEREADSVTSHPGSSTPSTMSHPRPHAANIIQRKLKFKPEHLKGEVSKSAEKSGQMWRQSTFSKISETLEKYWNTQDDKHRHFYTVDLITHTGQWLKKHTAKEGTEQYKSVEKLHEAVVGELEKIESQRYMEKYNSNGLSDDVSDEEKAKAKELFGKRFPSSLLNVVDDGIYAKGKQWRSDRKHGRFGHEGASQQQSEAIEKYEATRKYKLRPAERAALRAYSKDQYKFINPALERNYDWLEGNMKSMENDNSKMPMIRAGYAFDKSKKGLKTAKKDNQEIGKFAQRGLQKLPLWEQKKTLYRGETLSQKEYKTLEQTKIRKYNYFVSTSLEEGTPKVQIQEYDSKERPVKVLYHIESSSNGRDISQFSYYDNELEILFPPGTIFHVKNIKPDSDDPNLKHVYVDEGNRNNQQQKNNGTIGPQIITNSLPSIPKSTRTNSNNVITNSPKGIGTNFTNNYGQIMNKYQQQDAPSHVFDIGDLTLEDCETIKWLRDQDRDENKK